MLNGIDIDDVVDAIGATRWQSVALAAAFVAAAYFTLTFYDLFALRKIGKTRIPYRIAALAGFTSYSVGHNLGASVFTGSAVRYRIYSAHGLDAIDVAKVCFLAGLTFWLGNATVLGLGIAYQPEAASAIDQLPSELNRLLATVVLAALVAYVWWVSNGGPRHRQGRLSGHAAERPLHAAADRHRHRRPRLLRARDVRADARASPRSASSRWRSSSCRPRCSGFASHSPGGIGVFDAAMLVALYHFDREELLASLLLFRLLYYIVPFALALLVLGVRELVVGVGGAKSWIPPRKIRASAPIRTEIDRDPQLAVFAPLQSAHGEGCAEGVCLQAHVHRDARAAGRRAGAKRRAPALRRPAARGHARCTTTSASSATACSSRGPCRRHRRSTAATSASRCPPRTIPTTTRRSKA